MREEQNGSLTAPICVNDDFFSQLETIIAEAQLIAELEREAISKEG